MGGKSLYVLEEELTVLSGTVGVVFLLIYFCLVNSKCHKGDVLKKTKEKRKKRKHEGSLELVMQNFLCFVSPTQGKCKYF